MRYALLGIALAFVNPTPAHAPDQPLLVLASAGLPLYPGVARNAHISGDVRAEFIVDKDGAVSSVTIDSGPPLLERATEAYIKTWKFYPAGPEYPSWADHTTFHYNFEPESVHYDLSVNMETYRNIEVLVRKPPVLDTRGER